HDHQPGRGEDVWRERGGRRPAPRRGLCRSRRHGRGGARSRTRRPKAGAVEQELHLRRGGASLSLLAAATALRGPEGEYAGAVVVFEDLTELIKAQRVAA